MCVHVCVQARMHVPPREYAGQSSSLTNQFSPSTLGLKDCPRVVKLAGQELLFDDPPCPPLTPTPFTMQSVRHHRFCPSTPSGTKDSLELLFLCHHLPECRDYWRAPSHLAYTVLELAPRARCQLGRRSTKRAPSPGSLLTL